MKQVLRLLTQILSWSRVANFIGSLMFLTKRQYDRTVRRFLVFGHVNQRSDSWKFDGDRHHFYDNFMCVWDLIFFSSAKTYILLSCVLFYEKFSWVLPNVSRTRPTQFPCILKLQTPGCSQNSLTGNKNKLCHKPEDQSVFVKEVLFFLTVWRLTTHIWVVPHR